MKRELLTIALAAVLCGSICPMSFGQEQDTEDPLEVLAKNLVERLITKDRTRLTVLDFTDIQGRPNVLGRYLAERLDVQLANMDGITVVDRRNIARIMDEHKLTEEGLIDPANARKLGQFAGVEAILIGSLAIAEDNVELLTKAVSTETSEILSAGRTRLPLTQDFRQWLGQAIIPGSRPSGSAGGSPGASAIETGEITSREVGPITAALRNVTQHSIRLDQGTGAERSAPAIRCTFDLQNPNLERWAAVAVNRAIGSKGLLDRVYRGSLADSNHIAWTPIQVNGVSAVVCFHSQGLYASQVEQPNAAGIVDYIRTARKHDGASNFGSKEWRHPFWSGSFSPIPPGGKIRMTLDFVPDEMLSPPRGFRSSREGERYAPPDHFQFDVELVLATHAEGEDPAKARDLMLRNLTIDRVALVDKPTASQN